jgi:hypothetical protein
MKRLLLYAALLLLLTQCSKCKYDPEPKEPELPAETQIGAGTFGCKVNGQVLVAPNLNYIRSKLEFVDMFSIGGSGHIQRQKLHVGFILKDFLFRSNKRYLVLHPDTVLLRGNAAYADFSFVKPPGCYYSGERVLAGGYVHITRYDEAVRVLSGRFAYTLYEPGGCDTVRVTDGRFDVRWY